MKCDRLFCRRFAADALKAFLPQNKARLRISNFLEIDGILLLLKTCQESFSSGYLLSRNREYCGRRVPDEKPAKFRPREAHRRGVTFGRCVARERQKLRKLPACSASPASPFPGAPAEIELGKNFITFLQDFSFRILHWQRNKIIPCSITFLASTQKNLNLKLDELSEESSFFTGNSFLNNKVHPRLLFGVAAVPCHPFRRKFSLFSGLISATYQAFCPHPNFLRSSPRQAGRLSSRSNSLI